VAGEYKVFNRILLLAAIVLGVLIYCYRFFSSDTSCLSKRIADRECILCGCTRDFVDILSGIPPTRNPISLWLFYFICGELVFRFILSFLRSARKVIAVDVTVHAVILVIFIYYNFKIVFRF
jgi:hypothetical protein